MSIGLPCAATLSDGRPQLFVVKSDFGNITFSEWKTDPNNPDSDWSGWSQFSADDFLSVAVAASAPLSNSQPLLFGLTAVPSSVGILGGPSVATTTKISADPNSDWTSWQGFYGVSYGPAGSPDTGISSIAAGPLMNQAAGAQDITGNPFNRRVQLAVNGQVQVFMWEGPVGGAGPAPDRLMTNWTETSALDSWTGAQPFDPPAPETLWNLIVAPLSDNRLQLWGIGNSGIWTTWKTGGITASWEQWTSFQALPVNQAVAGLAVGQLRDGRLQLWGFTADPIGPVFTCQKSSASNSESPFTPWEPFFGTDFASLTSGLLSDGRLQLWGISQGQLLSAWQQSTDPDKPNWTEWSPFGGP